MLTSKPKRFQVTPSKVAKLIRNKDEWSIGAVQKIKKYIKKGGEGLIDRQKIDRYIDRYIDGQLGVKKKIKDYIETKTSFEFLKTNSCYILNQKVYRFIYTNMTSITKWILQELPLPNITYPTQITPNPQYRPYTVLKQTLQCTFSLWFQNGNNIELFGYSEFNISIYRKRERTSSADDITGSDGGEGVVALTTIGLVGIDPLISVG